MDGIPKNRPDLKKPSKFPDGKTGKSWQRIAIQDHHKVFLWDLDGVYVDCAFPNPVYGHLLGGETLLGRRVADILPLEAARRVLQGIQRTLKSSQSREMVITLERNSERYYTTIQLFPMRHYVMGLVTDSPYGPCLVQREPPDLVPERQQSHHDDAHSYLTKREWDILQTFGSGRSNPVIAKELGISERTVKFHFKNIFRKLKVTSRTHLTTFWLHNHQDVRVLNNPSHFLDEVVTH